MKCPLFKNERKKEEKKNLTRIRSKSFLFYDENSAWKRRRKEKKTDIRKPLFNVARHLRSNGSLLSFSMIVWAKTIWRQKSHKKK